MWVDAIAPVQFVSTWACSVDISYWLSGYSVQERQSSMASIEGSSEWILPGPTLPRIHCAAVTNFLIPWATAAARLGDSIALLIISSQPPLNYPQTTSTTCHLLNVVDCISALHDTRLKTAIKRTWHSLAFVAAVQQKFREHVGVTHGRGLWLHFD